MLEAKFISLKRFLKLCNIYVSVKKLICSFKIRVAEFYCQQLYRFGYQFTCNLNNMLFLSFQLDTM